MEECEIKGQFLYWSFTLPMYPDFWSSVIVVYDSEDVKKLLNNHSIREWIFQGERGESGYLHWQGWCKASSKLRFGEIVKVIPQAHWTKSRGPGAETYVHKSETRLYGPYSFPYRYSGEDIIKLLNPWQAGLRDILIGEVDPRKIYWYYDSVGNVGKTSLAKYLCWHHKAKLIGGKTADALFAATEGYTAAKPIFIVDIPRNQRNKVPYSALEALKNGLGFSSKYESKQYIGPPAHVVVFANYAPDLQALSADRWVVECLDPIVVLPAPPLDLII